MYPMPLRGANKRLNHQSNILGEEELHRCIGQEILAMCTALSSLL